jgi:hypothetical protein
MDGWVGGWLGNAWLWALVVPCLLFSCAFTIMVCVCVFFQFCGCQSLVNFLFIFVANFWEFTLKKRISKIIPNVFAHHSEKNSPNNKKKPMSLV